MKKYLLLIAIVFSTASFAQIGDRSYSVKAPAAAGDAPALPSEPGTTGTPIAESILGLVALGGAYGTSLLRKRKENNEKK